MAFRHSTGSVNVSPGWGYKIGKALQSAGQSMGNFGMGMNLLNQFKDPSQAVPQDNSAVLSPEEYQIYDKSQIPNALGIPSDLSSPTTPTLPNFGESALGTTFPKASLFPTGTYQDAVGRGLLDPNAPFNAISGDLSGQTQTYGQLPTGNPDFANAPVMEVDPETKRLMDKGAEATVNAHAQLNGLRGPSEVAATSTTDFPTTGQPKEVPQTNATTMRDIEQPYHQDTTINATVPQVGTPEQPPTNNLASLEELARKTKEIKEMFMGNAENEYDRSKREKLITTMGQMAAMRYMMGDSDGGEKLLGTVAALYKQDPYAQYLSSSMKTMMDQAFKTYNTQVTEGGKDLRQGLHENAETGRTGMKETGLGTRLDKTLASKEKIAGWNNATTLEARRIMERGRIEAAAQGKQMSMKDYRTSLFRFKPYVDSVGKADASEQLMTQIEGAKTNPAATKPLAISLARAAAGTARINIPEIKAMGGDQAFWSRIERFWTTQNAGVLRPDDYDQLGQLARLYYDSANQTAEGHRVNWSKMMSADNGLDVDSNYRSLLGVAPAGGPVTPAANPGQVPKIQATDNDPPNVKVQKYAQQHGLTLQQSEDWLRKNKVIR